MKKMFYRLNLEKLWKQASDDTISEIDAKIKN